MDKRKPQLNRSQSRAEMSMRGDVDSATWKIQFDDNSAACLIKSDGAWRILPMGELGLPGRPVESGVQGRHTIAWKVYHRLMYRTCKTRRELQQEIQGAMILEQG
jgi:hypothetical protein